MNLDKELWGIGLVGLLAAVAATLYGSAALWALGGRASRLLRLAPLALLLAALVPLGAYELVALFATQAIVAMGGISLWQSVRARRAEAATQVTARADGPGDAPLPAINSRPRFLLSDLLKAIVLIAMVAAIVRHAPPLAVATGGAAIDWWPWIVAGGGLGIITLAAVWTAQSSRRWYLRAIVFVVATLAGGALEAESAKGLFDFSVPLNRVPSDIPPGPLLASWQGLAMFVWLSLLRKANWVGWWRKGVRGGEQKSAPKDVLLQHRRVQRIARIVVGGACLLAAWILGSAFLALLPPAMPEPVMLPNPNGYDELMQAGQAVDWTAIPSGDKDEATAEARELFAQANAPASELMRRAFSKPSRVPLEYNSAHFSPSLNSTSNSRSLFYALHVQAKTALDAGRFGDAVRIYLDMFRLGRTISSGGLMIQELTANAFESDGAQGLIQQVRIDRLDAENLKLLRRELELLDASHEPFANIMERDRTWTKLSYGWGGRLFCWFEEALGGLENPQLFFASYGRVIAESRLLLTEAAIRAHIHAKGSPPDSLASLVPEFLSAVPQDPFGSGPLVYRRTEQEYLLYSLGGNRKDDGGQRVTQHEAIYGYVGDLFFDASTEMQTDPQDTEGSAAESNAASAIIDTVGDEKE